MKLNIVLPFLFAALPLTAHASHEKNVQTNSENSTNLFIAGGYAYSKNKEEAIERAHAAAIKKLVENPSLYTQISAWKDELREKPDDPSVPENKPWIEVQSSASFVKTEDLQKKFLVNLTAFTCGWRTSPWEWPSEGNYSLPYPNSEEEKIDCWSKNLIKTRADASFYCHHENPRLQKVIHSLSNYYGFYPSRSVNSEATYECKK